MGYRWRGKIKQAGVIPLSAALMLTLSGCVNVEKTPYPEDWPTLGDAVPSCQPLNGTYESRVDQATFQHHYQSNLLALILLPAVPALASSESVELQFQSEGSLRVAAYTGDGKLISQQQYNAGSGVFECKKGVLVFHADRKPGVKSALDNPMVGVSSFSQTFQSAVDHALVLHESGSATGMVFLLIPAHIKSEQWYLFRKLDHSPLK